jgi:hypothetical protein
MFNIFLFAMCICHNAYSLSFLVKNISVQVHLILCIFEKYDLTLMHLSNLG